MYHRAVRIAALTLGTLLVAATAAGRTIEPDDAASGRWSQLRWDDSVLPAGYGAIFLPSMALGVREPTIEVYDAVGDRAAEGQMGRRILLRPGVYAVRFGSGAQQQLQQTLHMRVEAGRTTVAEPTWAALVVRVVDPTTTPFRGSYELIRMADRREMGVGFGADELQGESLRVWILQPGLYRFVQLGGTYHDRVNFATVRLRAGELTRSVLVLERETGRLVGSGELDPGLLGADEASPDRWQLRAVLGGDVAFRQTDKIGVAAGRSADFDVFLDALAAYDDETHLSLLRLDAEAGLLRPLDGQRFATGGDRAVLDLVYVYQVWRGIGPYVRAGAETHVLPRRLLFDEPREVIELDASGQPTGGVQAVDELQVASPLSPLTFKQGLGGNARFSGDLFDISLRLGVGSRQTLPGDLRVYTENADAPDTLRPVDSSHTEGVESTVVVYVQILRALTLSTSFDGLVPFTDPAGTSFTWRNLLNLRLASFASLVYRVDLTVDPSLGDTTVRDVQRLLLRFSWVLF